MNSDHSSASSQYLHRATAPEYQAAASAAEQTLQSLLQHYPRANAMHTLLCRDAEANALWEMANYNAVAKLGYTDHGPIHAHMVAAAAVQLLQIFVEAGYTPDVVQAGAGDTDDAFTVVVAGALLHDVGNALTRDRQEVNGVLLAQPLLRRLLPELYPDRRQRTQMLAAMLSAIATHRAEPEPVTLEGSVVTVADATDITSGRGKISFEAGKIDIHAISALSIRTVTIESTQSDPPVAIEVDMSGEAGMFQVEQTLVRKLLRTPLRDLITVRACVYDSNHVQPHLIDCVALAGRKLRPAP